VRILPLPIYVFLDALIAKLDHDAAEEDLPGEAKLELQTWAENMRTVRRACRERDVLLGAIGKAGLEKARGALQAAADEA
jgi:hypothetical protein